MKALVMIMASQVSLCTRLTTCKWSQNDYVRKLIPLLSTIDRYIMYSIIELLSQIRSIVHII